MAKNTSPANVIIRTYKGKQSAATQKFQKDATLLAAEGYYPTSQVWAEGAYGCGDFIVALLLCFLVIGILIFIYMVLVKPPGTLTVTYARQAEQVPQAVPALTVVQTSSPPAPPTAPKKYFCFDGEQVIGPFDVAELKTMFFAGQINGQTQCCLEGANEWKNYQDI